MNGGADDNQEQQARCIVLRERGASLPPVLAQALNRPDFGTTECDNEFEALARLVEAARTNDNATVLLLVEPNKLGAANELSLLAERYARPATLWIFEDSPTPQVRAATPADRVEWQRSQTTEPPAPKPAAPRPGPPSARGAAVLSPATQTIADDAVSTSKVRIPAAPHLRLAGDGPALGPALSPARQPAVASEVKVRPASQRPVETRQEELSDTVDEGPGISPVPSVKAGHLLSDEELEMLLAPDPDKRHY